MPPRKRQKTSTATSSNGVLDIDSDGGLVLRAGTDSKAVLMRVSEDTITRMSKVFKVMLGPNFAESQKTHTATDPLKLPDDDPMAMELMMKMARHEIRTANEIRAQHIVPLVLLCEKYDCFKPFRGRFQAALAKWYAGLGNLHQNQLIPKTSTFALTDALCVAFITDDTDNFGDISHSIFQIAADDDLKHKRAFGPALLQVIPDYFQGKFRNQWEIGLTDSLDRFRESLKAATIRAMEQYYMPLNWLHYTRKANGDYRKIDCANCSLQVVQFIRCLEHCKCLPPFRVRSDTNMVRSTPFWSLVDGSMDDYCSAAGSCDELYCICERKLSDTAKEANQSAAGATGRACLICFKVGHPEKTMGRCGHRS